MSKPIQAAVIILFVLLIGSAGIAAFFLLQNQKLAQENQSLQSRVDEFQSKEADLIAKADKLKSDQQVLKDRMSENEKERDQAKVALEELRSKTEALNRQISEANQDRDDYKGRVETMRRERDELVERMRNQKEKVVEKIVEKIVYKDREFGAGDLASNTVNNVAVDNNSSDQRGDQYWANVLKQKEAFKLDLQKAQSDLDQSVLQVVELRKQNNDIQMQLKNLTDLKDGLERKLARDSEDLEIRMANEKKDLERRIKYSEDLANSLSMEVARTRSDKEADSQRAEKFKQENLTLQDQIRQLHTTKLALEKTIVQMNQEKVTMAKRLDQTEGAIQGRIDEIWKIKQNLDQKISQLPTTNIVAAPTQVKSAKIVSPEVELSPIVVNPSTNTFVKETPKAPAAAKNQPKPRASADISPSKTQGTIISINEPNNFVIVDLGENDASEVGNSLTVLRDNKPVGTLEVIQVRKDISAADIKDSKGALRVGDIVRYN